MNTTLPPASLFDDDFDPRLDGHLLLSVVGYGPDWNGAAQPIVTAAEFSRWIAARQSNDPNGIWAGTVSDDVDCLTYLSDEYAANYDGEAERFPLEFLLPDGTPAYRIEGWTFVRHTTTD
jgi:hypothetical protein